MRDFVLFYLNGKRHEVRGTDACLPLSDFLRERQRCRGVKVACGEGACGACTVLVGTPVADEATPRLQYHTAYSCLHPVFQMDGQHVVTVEGLTPTRVNDSGDALSAVQSAMVAGHGAQCGFCTPGFVVSLTALFDSASTPPDAPTIREAVSGNLCRCTGYLPILQSALGVDGDAARGAVEARFPSRPIVADLQTHTTDGVRLVTDQTMLLQPETWDEAVRLRAAHPDCRVIAGGTGFAGAAHVIDGSNTSTLLSLSALIDTVSVRIEASDALSLPATATWGRVAEAVQTVFPEFARQLGRFGSPQLRATATVGGSIAGAEGNADIFPLLLAQNARVALDSVGGRFEQPIADFLQAGCPSDTLVAGVIMPLPAANETVRLYKVRRRQAYDRSVFCAAVIMEIADGVILSARLAVGGVGPVPQRLPKTEVFLAGARFDEGTMREAGVIASGEIAPVRDSYADAEYRRQLVGNLLVRFWADVAPLTPHVHKYMNVGGERRGEESP